MKTILLLFFSLIFMPAFPQTVYEPLHSDVYNYLHRLSQKGIIDFNDLFKPLPRKYIYEKLTEAKGKTELLTDLEKEELKYFEKDYYIENSLDKKIHDENTVFFNEDSADRFRLFHYYSNVLKMNVSPVLGYKIEFKAGVRNTSFWNGINFYGYLPGKLGISLDFRITEEEGKNADRRKSFTPVTGIVRHDNKESFDYSEVKSSISYDWGWGSAVIAKEFIEYGYAESGHLVLSTKAPSFPYVMLNIKPADWINFIYFHAWLSSKVTDSVKVAEYKRDIYRSKYFAWHTVMVTPLKGLDISVGESVVYSDKPEIIYFMPLMFFFLADDFISHRTNKPGDANSQFFLSVSSKNHLKNTHLYTIFFADEITLRGIGGSIIPDNPDIIFDSNRLQVGYTFGASAADLPINNFGIAVEYTKIYPFVYGHHTPAQTYTNSTYVMGHWIGHNSDIVHIGLEYRFLRGLRMNIWGQYIRKGSSDYSGQYKSRPAAFLFGPDNNFKYFGINIKYELIHELNFEANYRHNISSNEENDGAFTDNVENVFSLSVYYGL